MKIIDIHSLTGRFPKSELTLPASIEGGSSAALDPFLYQDMRWCPKCGGEQVFIPVDRFEHGWRGYCLGCEEEKWVMDVRTSTDAA